MKRSAGVLAALAVVAVLVTSCLHQPPSSEGPETTFPPTESAPRNAAARVGATLNLMRIGEQQIAVTLLQVINPATVPNNWGEPGKNYIATRMTLTNTGTTTIVGNTNSNVTVVGSDNQEYRADFARVIECTDFVYGWFILPVGAAKTGCVTFALPTSVAPTKIRYTPSSGISHDVGEWLYP